MTRIFVDSSALLALLDADDPRHAVTRLAFEGMTDEELVTHGYVIAETLAVARRRFGVDGAIALIDEVLPAIDVLPVEDESFHSALRAYRASLPSGTSFVDKISLGLIEAHSIATVFALDPDLGVPGVTLLPS